MKNWLYILCLILIVSSCAYSDKPQQITVDNTFTIELPSHMKQGELSNIGEEPLLQYVNRFRNLYCIVLPANADSLMQFHQKRLAALKQSIDGATTDSFGVEMNGVQGIRENIYGNIDEETMYFHNQTIAVDQKLYHISVWTRSAKREQAYRPEIEAILASVKPK